MKKILFFLMGNFLALTLMAQTYRSTICDVISHKPLENVTILVSDKDGKNIGLGVTDNKGLFSIKIKENKVAKSLFVSFVGYKPYRLNIINNGTIPDTIFLHPDAMLGEVVVKGRRKYVKLYPDKIVYDVEKDSDAQTRNTFDIMRKVPLLIVSRKGDIRAADDKKIVYELNGMENPLLNDVYNALKALEAKGVKSIEVITQPEVRYGLNAIVVNIVTKGKIEGYRSVPRTDLEDKSLDNSIYGMTKIKRFLISVDYANLWHFNHSSKTTTDEYRLNSVSNHFLHKINKDNGFKEDCHSIEISTSYDLDDNTLLSAYGRVILKENPHQSISESAQMFCNNGSLNYAYNKYNYRLFENSEYQASLYYERNFIKNGKDGGKFFLGYEYYGRPSNETTDERYNYIDSLNMTRGSLDSYFNYNKKNKTRMDWHTFETEYRKVFSNNSIDADAKYIYRYQYDNYILMTAPLSSSQYALNNEGTMKYTQYQNVLNGSLSYSYKTSRYRMSVGSLYEMQKDRLCHSDRSHNFSRTFNNVLPFASASYVCSNNVSLEFGYNMSVQRPDIYSLDPYIDRTTPLQLSYGNTNLKPERTQSVQLSTNLNLGKYIMRWSLMHQYTDRIILEYNYLNGDTLNITRGNIGYKNTSTLNGFFSGHIFSSSYIRLTPSLNYISYNANLLNMKNHGFYFNLRGQWEQDLPLDFYFELGASYHSRYIMLQGKGSEGYRYDVTLSRTFLNKKLQLTFTTSSFLPVHYTEHTNKTADMYKYFQAYRYYHASFNFSVSYTFGHLKVHVKNTDKSISNNDIKKDYDE